MCTRIIIQKKEILIMLSKKLIMINNSLGIIQKISINKISRELNV